MSDEILRAARTFLTDAEANEATNRRRWQEDVKFARLGEQWPQTIKERRERENRPCLTVNKLGPIIRQVVNDARMNRPAVKVMPQDNNADPDTAEIMTGLIRNIEQASNADVAYDKAIDDSVSGGFGYWRINLEFANSIDFDNLENIGPEAFEQDIVIERVMNPLSVYADPHSTAADSSDWMECLVIERMSEKAFKKKYPDAKVSGFESSEWSEVENAWKTEKEISVAEYWVREEIETQIVAVQMVDGIDETGQPIIGDVVTLQVDKWEQMQAQGVIGQAIGNPRAVKSHKVKQFIVTGVEVLEENDWPGTFIPIVPVYGDEVVVGGERFFRSLISDARGPQEQENFWLTAATEMVALAPRAPYVGRKGAFTDPNWQHVNEASIPYLEFEGPDQPRREPPPNMPAADIRLALMNSDNIKAATGIYDASMGARSNETSGVAIKARQREGDVSTFHFIDNLSRAIRHTGKILLDLIPKVYSTQRIVRILGEDGKAENVQINGQQQDPQTGALIRIHDFKAGRYDVAVSTGPSFTTKREEAATQMIEFIREYPAAAPVIGDLLAKNFDWPGADEIGERLQMLFQQQFGGQQQQQPDPAAMAKAQTDAGKLQVEQFKAETDRMEAQASLQNQLTPQQVQQIVIQTMRQVLPGLAA